MQFALIPLYIIIVRFHLLGLEPFFPPLKILAQNKPFHPFKRLSVSVPPQKPMIIDDHGRHVSEGGELGVGPFREGDTLTLECNVPGGKTERERGKFRMTHRVG